MATRLSSRTGPVVAGTTVATPSPSVSSRAEGRRLLSFYDTLRDRFISRVEEKGGKLSRSAMEALLLVPDVFILLVRLTMDRDVPQTVRTLAGGALAYFLVPIDVLPEAFLGTGGFLDDVVLAAVVLTHAFGDEAAPFVDRYWSGRQEWRSALHDLSQSAATLLGENLYQRLRRVARRRGLEIDEDPGSKTQ